MSMFDAFFNKSFKAVKCKTLLKLTIPRIKLIRNKKEVQIRQMRRDIAKLLETGQEATARIRVEHIIRENNMMDAQELIELFCELISVRLPMIEAQRECPLDLKEAISSICFGAPRCADLPELMQVQMLFAAKYGKEFVSAATELIPDCGVNRQLIELLSVRPPAPDLKLEILKEIAEEHDLDWDPADSETELFKSHEDLLNGPTQIASGSKSPLFKEKIDESSLHSTADGDSSFDPLQFPEAPSASLRVASADRGSISEIKTLPSDESPNPDASESSSPLDSDPALTGKQFVPFMVSSSSLPSKENVSIREESHPEGCSGPAFKPKSDVRVDLNDVLAAAHAAAESAERAALAARSAASLAEVRIAELVKNNGRANEENPFGAYSCNSKEEAEGEENSDAGLGNKMEAVDLPRVGSVEDEMYPNLFTSQGSS